mmetsp:Transcript_29223/g.93897  ORF Transcript_29223/g.93897 Transcript_29223/m.93897 type:complete len:102 (+) Transcript_29223:602-907(+)
MDQGSARFCGDASDGSSCPRVFNRTLTQTRRRLHIFLLSPALLTLCRLVWLRTRYNSMLQAEGGHDLLECTIEPGELLYFPDNWFHATLNIGQSVFMSTFV